MITELKSNCMPVSKDGKFSYNILFEDSFADLPEAMADLELETHKICIVSDSNVGPLYAETVKAELEKTNDVAAASYLGKVIAERALAKGITEVVFDRGGFIYHGKIEALADAAREAGLKF